MADVSKNMVETDVPEVLRAAILTLQSDADAIAMLADDDDNLIDAVGRQLYGEGAGARLVRALYMISGLNPVADQVDPLEATRPAF